MGVIRQSAIAHFQQYPNEEHLVKAFLPLFYITWGKKIRRYNTELSFFLLSPEDDTKKYFSFLHEILLVYVPFSQLQDRTMKAIDQIFLEDPAKGRVETFSWIIITKNKSAENWFSDYCISNGITKTIIPLFEDELLAHQDDSNYIKDILSNYLFVKDWFDKSLPLKDAETFFGRVMVLNEIRQGIRNGENIGLFGLRKTGKTSIICRVQETLSNDTHVIIYDCRQPRYRNLHWLEFLKVIVDDIISVSEFRGTLNKTLRSDELFIDLMKKFNKKKHILLVFDEFEFISNIAQRDKHWQTEFLDFWQTLQAVQNETNKISFLIAGVNPYSIEESLIHGEQNPLFNIFHIIYVTGFDLDNVKSMVQILGQRMGLFFDDAFCQKLYTSFGGHPLLCRLACSVVHKKKMNDGFPRPLKVTNEIFNDPSFIDETNYIISIYCKDIINPLRDFYHDEYEMLTYVAIGDNISFLEFAKDPTLIRHLKKYGILEYSNNQRPIIKIEALSLLIAQEYQIENKIDVSRYIVPHEQRDKWLKERVNQIDGNWKRLRRLVQQTEGIFFYDSSEIPNMLRFMSIHLVKNQEDCESFISAMNICFVESIENYGKSKKIDNFFWNEVKKTYEYLFHAFLRIKTYRHAINHEKLNPNFQKYYDDFLKEDFSGKDYRYINDGFFICQQVVLDSLVEAFMLEVNNLE